MARRHASHRHARSTATREQSNFVGGERRCHQPPPANRENAADVATRCASASAVGVATRCGSASAAGAHVATRRGSASAVVGVRVATANPKNAICCVETREWRWVPVATLGDEVPVATRDEEVLVAETLGEVLWGEGMEMCEVWRRHAVGERQFSQSPRAISRAAQRL